MTRNLGQTVRGRLMMRLVLARVVHQGSQLSAVRWSQQHAVTESLVVTGMHENSVRDAPDWAVTLA